MAGTRAEPSATIALDMDAVVTEAPYTENLRLHRCAGCGIESSEPTCFVLPERHDKRPRDTFCITCERQRSNTSIADGLTGILRTTFVPVLVLVSIERGLGDLTFPVVLAACLMSPIAIFVHEVGHAAAARLLGLEVATVIIGVGPRIWREKVFGTWFTLHAWPLSGLTFLGSTSLELLRTRLWLTVLMGPATNIALVAATTLHWEQLILLFGVPILSLWCITNALLALQSLTPKYFKHLGDTLSTDGLALLQIPRSTSEQLESYLFTAPLLRASTQFEEGDYSGAQATCAEGLEAEPSNVHLRLLMSTCRSYQHDFHGALITLRQLLRSPSMAEPAMRAAIESNTAFALLMSNPHTASSTNLQEAERLSARAFAQYPCILPYRSTRALILAATGRAAEALTLLHYCHYQTADRGHRAHAAIARAFALAKDHHTCESRTAAHQAVTLYPESVGFLKVLGVGYAVRE